MTDFPLVACVVAHTQEVIPGLNTPAFMFTWVWTAPISDPAGAQQDFCISAPFPLQHDIYIHRLIVYEDLLHAAVEARQLGHTASRVIGFRTTCSTTDMK